MFQVIEKYTPKRHTDVITHKMAVPGTAFLNNRDTQDMLLASRRAHFTVGHVRAATAGAVTPGNAHPFITKREDGTRIVGVHNGSLSTGWRDRIDASKFEVDSQWIYHCIAKDGDDAFAAIDGHYALVWYDEAEPGVLHVVRNQHRPLFWANTEGGKGLIACSELGMLGWLADRNGMKLQKSKHGQTNSIFRSPSPGVHYRIKLDDLTDIQGTKVPDFSSADRRYHRHAVQGHMAPQTAGTNLVPTGAASARVVRGPSSPTPRYASHVTDDMDELEQMMCLSEIKEALKEGRRRVEVDRAAAKVAATKTPDPVVAVAAIPAEDQPDSGLRRAMSRVIEQYHARGTGILDAPKGTMRMISQPVANNVTVPEKNRARATGLFGAIIDFFGYDYFDETGEVIGAFQFGGEGEAFDAIVRGYSSKASEHLRQPDKYTKMCIIGMDNSKAPIYIVAPFDESVATYLTGEPAKSKYEIN